MKTLLSIFIANLISGLAFSQHSLDDFTRQKKYAELNTAICMGYIDTGNPNGIPVLLLHGYTDTSRSFQFVIEELKAINGQIRIIAPDLRGHGDTSIPDMNQCNDAPQQCFTLDKFAADVVDLMDQLCINKVHVVGHSMGSIIAQSMALNYTDRVASMTLLGTFVNGKECSTIQDFFIADLIGKDWKCMLEEQGVSPWPAGAYAISPFDMGERVKNFLKENWVVEAATSEDFLQKIFPETLRIPLATWIGAITALGEIDYRSALKKLTTPTLIIWGSQDVVVNKHDQEQVKEAFQSAAKSTGTKVSFKTFGKLPLPDQGNLLQEPGHNFHWAAPKAVAEDIHSFIMEGTH